MSSQLERLVTTPHERTQLVRWISGDHLRGIAPTRWWVEKVCTDADTAELYARKLETTLRALRTDHRPEDGSWTCPEDSVFEDCNGCMSGSEHEGKVCYTCSDLECSMAIWPCAVARTIDEALGNDVAVVNPGAMPEDRTATPEGRAQILAEWDSAERDS